MLLSQRYNNLAIHRCQIWLIYHSLLSTPPKKSLHEMASDWASPILLSLTQTRHLIIASFFCHLHNVRLCRVLCPPSSSSSISPRNAIHITTRNIPDGFLIHEVSVSRCISYHHQLAKSNPSLVMPRSVECWE